MAYADLSKRIEIVMEYVTKGTAKAKAAADSINSKMRKSRERLNKSAFGNTPMSKFARKAGIYNMGELDETMKSMKMHMGANGQMFMKGRKGSLRYAEAVNMVKKKHDALYGSTKRFKYEYLGLMFAGMAVKKMFEGYVNQVDSWMGFSELFGTSLSLLTLDAVEPLSDSIYNLIDSIFTLQGTTAGKLVGSMIVGGYAIGGFTQYASQAVLAVSSFRLAFPLLSASIAAGMGEIYAAILPVAIPLLAILAMFVGIYVAVKGIIGLVSELGKLSQVAKNIGGWGNVAGAMGWGGATWNESAYRAAQGNRGGTTTVAPTINYNQAPGVAMTPFDEHQFQNTISLGLGNAMANTSKRTG